MSTGNLDIITDGLVLHLDAGNIKSYTTPNNLLTNLIGYFKFNGNATNTIGSVASSEYNITYPSGKINQSASFNGSLTSYVQTSLVHNLSSPYDEFTVGVWVKTSGTPLGIAYPSNQCPVSNYAGNPVPYNLYVINSEAVLHTGVFAGSTRDDATNIVTLYGTSRVDDGNWHYCVYKKDATTFYVYVDGVLENTTPNTMVAAITTGNTIALGILNYYLTDGIFFGEMDELGIWTRSLTQDEISLLYNNNLGLTHNFDFWFDLRSNGNNGELINGPTYNNNNSGSISFDGIDSYISLTPITNNVYTVSFWTKLSGNDGSYGYFGSDGITTPWPLTKGFAISEGGTFVGLVYGDLYYYNGSSPEKIGHINDGWNNVCLVINTLTDYITTYINGQLDNNYNISGLSPTVDTIGIWNKTTFNALYGYIGIYKIYNRPLTPTEVLHNYNNLKWRYL